MKRIFTLLSVLLVFISHGNTWSKTPAGTITPIGVLTALSTTYGTASSTSTFAFTASGLGASEIVTVTAPTGFEVSLSSGSGFANFVTVTANGGGNISSTPIYVRLSAAATPGTYSGNVTLVGASASANEATASSTVSPKALTITGVTASNKTYDGTNSATMGGTPALSGVLGADAGYVSLDATSASGTFASVNVGTGITVTGSSYALVAGGSGDHTAYYTLTQPTTTANITAINLTISGVTANNKTYDGTNAATLTGTAALVGVLAGDAGYVSLNSGAAAATFSSVNVGTGITVNTSGYALAAGGSGDRTGNYTLTQPTLSANITAITLTITGVTASNKIYDGATSATLGGSPVLVGVLAGDAGYVSLNSGSASGTFASINVGTGITVTASGYALAAGGSGDHSGNYTLTQPTTTANITAKGLTISGATANNKVYDRTNAATMGGAPTLVGLVSGDGAYVTLNTSSATGTFASVTVGTSIVVTGSGYALAAGGSGDRTGNYTLTQPSTTADITSKNLTITGITINNKVYDGTTSATIAGTATLNGVINPDVVTVSGGSAVFTTAATSAGQANVPVTVSGYTLGGADAGNYSLTQPTGLTASIYASEPSTQAKNLTFSGVTAVSMTIGWTVGNGTNRLVLVNEGSSVSASPTDFTSYTASTDWLVKGSQIGSGNYVVYTGTGTSVSITDLNPNTTYNVQVFEFNGAAGTGLENYNTGTATNNPKGQATSNVDATATFSAGTGPLTIASTVTTLGAEVMAFQFTATDLASGDGTSTRFTQLVFKAGAGNQVSNWTQLIKGAELFDNAGFGGTYSGSGPTTGTHGLAVIATGPNTITIPTISAGGNGTSTFDLGTIKDGTSRIYTLKIYFYPTLLGSLPTTVDNLHLEFSITGSDVTAVSGKGTFAAATTTSSGSTNDQVTVTASQITFTQQPAATAFASVPLSQQPILKATDVNGNLDLNTISASVTAGSLGPNGAPTGFTNGFMDFSTANTYNYSNTGTSTMTVTTTSAPIGLTVTSSQATTVTATTTLASSATAMSSSPLFNSSSGSISGGVATNAVLGFSLATSGSTLNVTQLVFSSSVSPTNLMSGFKLYSNTSDSFTGATQVATSTSLTFSSLSISVSATPKYFFLVADVDPYFPSLNPTINFSLQTSGVTVSAGTVTGSTQTGAIIYTLKDNTPPTLQSLTIIPPPTTNSWSTTNGTSASTVTFRATFSEPVTGIQYSGGNKNFQITKTGTVGSSTPTGASSTPTATSSGPYYVDISLTSMSGQGDVRLDFLDRDNITDAAGNPVGGVGIGNGDFTTSFSGNQYYTIVLPQPAVEAITFNPSTSTGNSITLSWVGTTTTPVPTHFLVLAKTTTGGSYPTVADGTYISDGALAQNVAYVVGTNTVTFTGLNSGTSYDFIVYKYALGANTTSDNIDFETTTPGVKTVSTTTAAVSWMTLNSTTTPISSLSNSSGSSTSVMSFKIYDDGQDPISPNVMTLHLNDVSQESVTFTLRDELTLAEGASVTGFTSSTGSVATAIYSGKGTTNTITLTNASDGTWTSATKISYSASTGNAVFINLGKMQTITSHAVVIVADQVTIYNVNGTSSFPVPAGVTKIQVEAWGAGGSGGGWSNLWGGGSQGGGGGAYSRSVLTVNPGDVYTVVVGKGGASVGREDATCCAPGNAGSASSFGSSLVTAAGGQGGESAAYFAYYGRDYVGNLSTGRFGLGGQASNSVGSVTFSGGNGGNGGSYVSTNNGSNASGVFPWLYTPGGTGGTSAGSAANGINGTPGPITAASTSAYSSYTVTSGPTAPTDGGNGGYAYWNWYGGIGGAPGGGGGGFNDSYNNYPTSGAGADGQIKITYSGTSASPGTSEWAGDNSPFKFSQIVITQGTGTSASLVNNLQSVLAGAELSDGTNTVSGTVNNSNITFASIPSTTSSDLGYVPDATNSLSSKTYTLKVWIKNNLSNSLAASIDGLNLDFKVDPTVAANLSYDDATNNNQQSSRLTSPAPSFNSGALPVQVVATQLVYHQPGSTSPTVTNPQAQIGVKIPFSSSTNQQPEVWALDANNNVDLGYNNSATISNTQNFGQSVSSLSFASGKLALSSFNFTTGSATTLNTQIVVTAPSVTAATSTNVWPVISNLTTISAATAPGSELASFPSTTTSTPAAFNFDFTVTDDVGADGSTFTNNDGLPTIIPSITISQDTNNGINGGGADATTFDKWTLSVQGAQLSDGTNTVLASTIADNSISFNLPAAMQTITDGGSKTYQLRIWLKNPVDPTLADILDNKDYAFTIDQSGLGITATPNTSSAYANSSTNTGDGRNVVTVTASQLDFVTQWLTNANQSYDAALSPTPAAKARDADGNLDTDYNTAVTVATTNTSTYPLANSTVTNTNGVISFNSGLQVTSAGGGTNGGTTQLKMTSGALSGISNVFILNYSGNSDIVRKTSFTHPQNIDYATVNNQAVLTGITSGTGTTIETFTVRDGGGASDADGTSTVVGSITFTLQNPGVLRNLALFNNAGNKVAELVVASSLVGGSDITFSGLPTSGVNAIIASDNSSTDFTVKASFLNSNIPDNTVVNINVKSIVAGAVSSSFTIGAATTMPALAAKENQIEVIATQIVYTTIPATASLNVPFAVTVQAQDTNGNLDVDYNGTISTFATTPGSPSFITTNNPSGAFAGGILNFPYTAGPPATGFQFTTGNGSTQLVLNSGAANSSGASIDAGAIAGTSAMINVITSFDSWLYFDPSFTYTSQIDFIPFQNTSTSASSQALAKVILSDGGAPGSSVNPSGIKNLPFGSHNDTDGAFTKISDFSVSLTNFASIKKIGLYTVGGVQIGSDQAPSSTVTFSGLTGYPAPDDDVIAYIIRAEFNSTITDQTQITMQISGVTLSAGSNFPTNGSIAGVPGGDVPPTGQNFLNVIATSLDFTTQPTSNGVVGLPHYAGINEPVGTDNATGGTGQPYSYGNPAALTSMPTTTAGIVTARDKYANVDTGFSPASIQITDSNSVPSNLGPPVSFNFTAGVLNLNGITYPKVGNGAVKVITPATGPSPAIDSSVPTGIGNSIPCETVNVLDVTVSQDITNVPQGSGSPATLSLKGGLQGVRIFGLKFTANNTAGSEPKLKSFIIGFKDLLGADKPFVGGSFGTIFQNLHILDGSGSDITTSSSVVSQSSTGSTTAFDQVLVTPPTPASITSSGISYFLVVDVNSNTNTATKEIIPYFKDSGYGYSDDQNTVVTNGTASGAFDGNVYTFASTKAPTLQADLNKYPTTVTRPYLGQPNVDKDIQQIVLQFDTKVVSLDGGGKGSLELWNREFNTKVADLKLNASQTVAVVGAQTVTSTLYSSLIFDIVNRATPSLYYDSVYFVKIVQGSYDPNTQVGHGISDYSLNFYGGITDNSTMYFKISSNKQIKLLDAKSPFTSTTLATLTTSFDQLGKAYYLIVKSGDPAPSISEITGIQNYAANNPLATVAAIGNYLITSVGDPNVTLLANQIYQTVTFPGTFATTNDYDVYLFAENDGLPTPTPAAGIYPKFTILGSGISASQSTNTPTSSLLYKLCPNSSVKISNPMIVAETSSLSFSANYVQDFNVLLPTGFEFDVNVAPNVQLIGGNFQNLSSFIYSTSLSSGTGKIDFTVTSNAVTGTGSAFLSEVTVGDMLSLGASSIGVVSSIIDDTHLTLASNPTSTLTGAAYKIRKHPGWEYNYTSNTLLNIRFFNQNNPTDTQDFIALSGMSIIGGDSKTSPQGKIQWFFGNNVFTTAGNSTFDLASISVNTVSPSNPDFNNSYWVQNQPFPSPDGPPISGPVYTAFAKTVNTIPDNYVDSNNPGAVRLLPSTGFAPGDYLASLFSGNGVSGDLLTLNAVTPGASFFISMDHTDLNGCETQRQEQYIVYDHNNPISKKLGVTPNATKISSTNPLAPAGTVQDIVNTNFNSTTTPIANPGQANPITSPTLGASELAGFTLLQLTADLPSSAIAGNPTIPMSGPNWRTLVQTSVITTNAPPYAWDYSAVLNASTSVTGVGNVYDYFKTNGSTIPYSPQGNNYWIGGSLGKIQYTGAYQSTADNAVYVPFRQEVELFVPAVPLIEVTSPSPAYDKGDLAMMPTFNSIQYPSSNKTNGYPGTSTFCEFGGTITLTAYPAPSGGKSTGKFQIYDYASYNAFLAASPIAGGGKIITLYGSTSVIGISTSFTQLSVDTEIYDINGVLIGKIQSIKDDTHLTLTTWATRASVNAITGDSYSFKKPAVVLGTFTDNFNGTMTLDPAIVKNNYNDILVTYTYQEDKSPAVGVGYLIIRVTPNPVAKFTVASTVANPGASAFNAGCAGTPITFDASVSTINGQAPASNANYYVANYAWNFGDPGSGSANSPSLVAGTPGGAGPTPTVTVGPAIPSSDVQPNAPAAQTFDKPVHIFNVSSTYTVSLSLTSNWGCPSLTNNAVLPGNTVLNATNVLYPGYQGSVKIGEVPIPDFYFRGNCEGDNITFTSTSTMPSGSSSNSSIVNYDWNFGGSGTPVVTSLTPGSQKIILTSTSNASITNAVINSVGCQASKQEFITILKLIDNTNLSTATKSYYVESFELGDGGFQTLPLQATDTTSWVFGFPNQYYVNDTINGNKKSIYLTRDSATYKHYWATTSLPYHTIDPNTGKWTMSTSNKGGSYYSNEQSALYFPCFDLSALERPMISFSYFKSLQPSDGAVLQWSTDDYNVTDPKKVWTVLGSYENGLSDGLDWYNAQALASSPGTDGSSLANIHGYGWSDSLWHWKTARHELDTLKKPNRVQFRLALSSVNKQNNSYDGFAIDSVRIGDRTRTILFENFTTTDGGNSALNTTLAQEANYISTFTTKNVGTQLVNINYHIGFLGKDPFNLDDPADPSARALYYNVKQAPFAFLDGTHYKDYGSGTDLFQDWGQRAYNLQTLQLAKADFSPTISPASPGTTVTVDNTKGIVVDVNFIPTVDLPHGNNGVGGTLLYVAFLEESVLKSQLPSGTNIGTTETNFNYILKRILPDATGFRIPVTTSLQRGKLVSLGQFTWIPEKLYTSNLSVVVFLQNENTREVYQAELFQHVSAPASPITAIEPLSEENIQVYPNPSDREFTIELPQAAKQKTSILMVDQLGRFIEAGEFQEGEQKKTVSTQGLSDGMYILQVGDNENAARKKVMVIHK